MLTWFDLAKYYYDNGYWTKDYVYSLVPQTITADQYKEITGETYQETTNTTSK